MIVVLCDHFQDAKDAFDIFCSFLEQYEPFMIEEFDPYSLRVVTDEDLVYIFVDYKMSGVFDKKEDLIEVEQFFTDLYSNYDEEVFKDFHDGWIPW